MLREYLKKEYGKKLYKISIDAGFTCPNRDGTCGAGGCVFCSGGGSGEFAWQHGPEKEYTGWLREAIDCGKRQTEAKFHPDTPGENYIAYFQAFTNTYAPVEKLRQIFEEAVRHPDVAVLSIATRPDCLEPEKVELLKRLNREKPVWVELGLQTIHERTAEWINRCYPTAKYDEAVEMLRFAGIKTITHVILGLPGETEQEMFETVRHVAQSGSWGIKLQMLHILRGTRLAEIYEKDPFPLFSLEEYVELISKILQLLPDSMVVHRLTGDGPKKLLIEPKWSGDKKRVMNALQAAVKDNRH